MKDDVVTIKPQVMHGEPCFTGTRVTTQTFFDHLEAGYSIDGFIAQFPTVRRELVIRFLETLEMDVPQVATCGDGGCEVAKTRSIKTHF